MSSPFVLDLVALYNTIEESIVKTLNKARKEGWTPDQLIKKIEKEI